jgi:hypothetical protein
MSPKGEDGLSRKNRAALLHKMSRFCSALRNGAVSIVSMATSICA